MSYLDKEVTDMKERLNLLEWIAQVGVILMAIMFAYLVLSAVIK